MISSKHWGLSWKNNKNMTPEQISKIVPEEKEGKSIFLIGADFATPRDYIREGWNACRAKVIESLQSSDLVSMKEVVEKIEELKTSFSEDVLIVKLRQWKALKKQK